MIATNKNAPTQRRICFAVAPPFKNIFGINSARKPDGICQLSAVYVALPLNLHHYIVWRPPAKLIVLYVKAADVCAGTANGRIR